MSGRLDDYAASIAAGMQEGMGDVARSAIADIGDSYQEILMSDASISAPDGLTGTMEAASYEMEREEAPAALETDPAPAAPDIDME